MNRLLIRKCVHESSLLLLACASMLFVFCWMRVWIVCQFDLQKFEPLLEQFRIFEKFSPVPFEQLLTYAGSIGMSFSEPVLILCVLVWSIARGSDVVSGELGRGTLEMLLSRPISRTRLLVVHFSVCTLGLAVLCSIAWMGIAVGIHTNSVTETMSSSAELKIPFLPVGIPLQFGESVEVQTPLASRVAASRFLPTTVNLFAFGFLMLGLSTLLSCVDRYRWRTIGIVISIYVVQLLMFLLSKAVSSWRWLEDFTFFTNYQPDAIVHLAGSQPQLAWSLIVPVGQRSVLWPHTLGPLGLSLQMILYGSLCFAIGLYLFHRRDLPAPL
ncbi:MAG: ABC transporter permease subunit [Pirellulaceae bacterium]